MKYSELLDYYHAYCEMTIWFRKIMFHSNKKAVISIKDITETCTRERNRILQYIPLEKQKILEKELDAIAAGYCSKIMHWTKKQKEITDMV